MHLPANTSIDYVVAAYFKDIVGRLLKKIDKKHLHL